MGIADKYPLSHNFLPKPYEDLIYAVLERAAKDLKVAEKKKRQGKQLNYNDISAEIFFTSGEAYEIYGKIANTIYKRIVDEDS